MHRILLLFTNFEQLIRTRVCCAMSTSSYHCKRTPTRVYPATAFLRRGILCLLRGMPRYSRISIIRVNTNATVCGYTVVFRLSISLANTIAFTSTLTSIYLPLFSYYLLKQQKYSYKSISCHCVSTERYAMFALDMPRSFCNK